MRHNRLSKILPTFTLKGRINTFKYHVSCTGGKISVRINLLFYLFFTVVPSNSCVFLSSRLFVVNTFSSGLVGAEVSSVSWLGQLEFKSLIIAIVGFQLIITIISDLNSNCQLPKSADRTNFNTHKTCWECRVNNERPTGKKHTSVGWDDCAK